MAERIFLHVGLPKSGTTYLQTIMWRNRRRLRAQGLLYPGHRRMDHYNAFRGAQGGTGPEATAMAAVWDSFVEELAAWPGTGLLSHEFWSLLTRQQAVDAVRRLAPAPVEVVITARDYVRQFTAVWQEALKMQADDSFDEFTARALAGTLTGPWSWRSQDVPAIARRWAAAVGDPGRVHLITVPPPGADPGVLWARWREVIGFDDTGFKLGGQGNESIGAPQAALLHAVKPYLSEPLTTKPEFHRWVRQYFGHEVLVPQAGPRFGMRPDAAAVLRERSVADVAELAAAGYRVTGDLDELVPPEQQQPRPHPDDVTDAEKLEVAGRAIDQMIRDVRALTVERNEWRRRALRAESGLSRLGMAKVARTARTARVARLPLVRRLVGRFRSGDDGTDPTGG